MTRDEEKYVRIDKKEYYDCGYEIESIKDVRQLLLDFHEALRSMDMKGKSVADHFDFCYNQHYKKLGDVAQKHGYANFPPPYFRNIQTLAELMETTRNLERMMQQNVNNMIFASGGFFKRAWHSKNLILPTEYSAGRIQKVIGNVTGEVIEKADFTTGGKNDFCFSVPNSFWLYASGMEDKQNGVSFVTTTLKFDPKKALRDLANMNVSDERLTREEFLSLMNSISPYVDNGMVRIIFGNPNQMYEVSNGYNVPFKSTIRSNGAATNADNDTQVVLSTGKLEEMSLLKLEMADYACICNFGGIYSAELCSINLIVDEAFMDEFMNSDYKNRLTDFFAVNLEYSKAKRKGADSSEFNQTMIAPTDDRVKRKIFVPEIKK